MFTVTLSLLARESDHEKWTGAAPLVRHHFDTFKEAQLFMVGEAQTVFRESLKRCGRTNVTYGWIPSEMRNSTREVFTHEPDGMKRMYEYNIEHVQ